MNLQLEFNQYRTSKKLYLPDTTVLITVSGGIDSMVMAALFLESGIQFGVAHCNFQLRGDASDLDEELVTAWCEKNNILLHTKRFDTTYFAEEWKKGIQETARILRYVWFEQLRKEHHYTKTATAHHANDNVETLLINLFKGTGISGIHGILPEQNRIIRPLLFAQKKDIIAYADEHNIAYREDKSNASDDYLRNAVRHSVVPAIEALFPHAIQSMQDSIGRFAEAEILYRRAIQTELKKLVEQRGQDLYIPVLKLWKCTPLSTICYELIQPYNFTPAQTEQVLHLLSSDSGHYLQSNTHRIIRNRDFLIITTLPAPTADLILVESAPCTVDTHQYRFSFSIIEPPAQIDTSQDTALLDLNTIEFPLILRPCKTGDYFYPLGMQMKKKKVSRVLINEKVPLHEKEHIRIIECNKRIVWVAGIRLDERFKITGRTEQVLQIKKTLLTR